jgi:hypothetical protein
MREFAGLVVAISLFVLLISNFMQGIEISELESRVAKLEQRR